MSDETVLKYLRDISDKVIALELKLDKIEERVEKLGVGCKEAFKSTKDVIGSLRDVTEALAEQQKGTREDLAEAAGTVDTDSWWS
jgi:hypothetical protein